MRRIDDEVYLLSPEDEIFNSALELALEIIGNEPAADVRGEWIPIDELPWDEANTFLCSACHSECDTHNGDYDLPYFCPNCGADMRGEDK